MRFRKSILVSTLALMLGSGAAFARDNLALLVGASSYPALDEKYWLKGPQNDVVLVRDYLLTNPAIPFAAEDVVVLADGVEGASEPTLAAIRQAMADLAAKAGPGDFVYLQFSGHGSQTPAADPASELDGLDEIFLPVDIGPWTDEVAHVQNALVDDEIGTMIDAIRAKGADVWVVFDSCHSGTATRGTAPEGEELRMRQLPPEALAIPADMMEPVLSRNIGEDDGDAEAAPFVPTVTDAEMGSLVAFFAAQTTETTPEKNMPRGEPGRKPQGIFTWTLFQALAEHPGITYRQLGQEVLRAYSVQNLARSTPLFEGDLDQMVFGLEGGSAVLQWPVTPGTSDLTIPAGQLHGLAEGTELVLLASPADPTEAALASVKVTKVDQLSAELSLPEGVELPKGAVARRIGSSISYELSVALPDVTDSASEALVAELKALREAGEIGARVQLVAPDAEADLRLVLEGEELVLVSATGLGDETDPRLNLAGLSPEQRLIALGDALTRVARASNLMKIGALPAGTEVPKVQADVMKARFDAAKGEVEEASRAVLETATVPDLVPNDVIGLALSNDSETPVDFNILYIGSDWSVSFMGNGRMQPGDQLSEDYVLITDAAYGRDRMLVILSPAAPQSPVEDLSFLAQDGATLRDASEQSDIAALLSDAGFGSGTRSAVSLSSKKKAEGPAPVILQFEFATTPEAGSAP